MKVAIIVARGGSKRIPQKNIKTFLGEPIIRYSIRAALEALVFDEVMVSTDDDEIAKISIECGAKVPFIRSKSTSDDYASVSDVIYEVLMEYIGRGREFDFGCCIYATAPFLKGETLSKAFEILEKSKEAHSIIPVVKYGFPPQRAFVIEDKFVNYKHPQYASSRSQDLEEMYHDCGQFCAFRVSSFMECRELVSDKTIPYILQSKEVQDIDTEEDWSMAELKYKLLNLGSKKELR